MVTSAPASHRSTATSWPELAAPMTTAFLPLYFELSAYWLECRISPLKSAAPGRLDQFRRAVGAGGEDQLRGAQDDRLAVAHQLDGPAHVTLVEACRDALGAAPIAQLHHLDVHLEPVAHLVLGGEDGPVGGERDVGQVIVPDRVVQHERAVAVAPGIAGLRVLLDDHRRHAELLQARAEHDAALPAADDEAIGLGAVAESGFLGGPALRPGRAIAVGAVADAQSDGWRRRPPRGHRATAAW